MGKFEYVILSLIGVMILGGGIIIATSDNRSQNEKDYPNIGSKSIYGVFKEVQNEKTTYFIDLNNNVKFKIIGTPMLLNAPQDIEYIKTYLDNFLVMGDSLARQPNNDTLSVFRNGKQYDFLMPSNDEY